MPLELNNISEHYRTNESYLFHELREKARLAVKVPAKLERDVRHYLRKLFVNAEEFIDSSSLFYRARIHEFGQTEAYSFDNIGAPPKNKAGHGRIQAKGEVVLYMATNVSTAIAEIRPCVGSLITVGEFCPKVGKRLRVLNLTCHQSVSDCVGIETIDFVILNNIIKSMNFSQAEFSRQLHSDHPGRFLDTIYISQLIKNYGFDGVAYKSLLDNRGINYAFFKPKKFRCVATSIRKVTSVLVSSEPYPER